MLCVATTCRYYIRVGVLSTTNEGACPEGEEHPFWPNEDAYICCERTRYGKSIPLGSDGLPLDNSSYAAAVAAAAAAAAATPSADEAVWVRLHDEADSASGNGAADVGTAATDGAGTVKETFSTWTNRANMTVAAAKAAAKAAAAADDAAAADHDRDIEGSERRAKCVQYQDDFRYQLHDDSIVELTLFSLERQRSMKWCVA
jgi:hypothetical protein